MTTESEWVCRKCGATFRPTPSQAKKRYFRCRRCQTDRAFALNQKHPHRTTLQVRRFNEANPEKAREYARRTSAKQIASGRARVQLKLQRAARRGLLIRPPGKEFHHPDYSRPYYGCWVTPREHRQIHAGRIPCPPCVDYADVIEAARPFTKEPR